MLMRAFVQTYDVEVAYVESVPVKDTFQGQTAWEGIVDVFDLKGHPRVVRGYGWPYEIKDGDIQYATVLAQQPINSPLAAVRAFIRSQASERP